MCFLSRTRFESVIRVIVLLVAFGLSVADSGLAQPADVRSQVFVDDSRIGLVQGLAIDGDQNVYVGDLMNTTVHRYTEDGTYDRAFGRKGQGPGEFRGVTGIQIGPGDSLYVHDRQARRVTVFPTNSSGEPRTIRFPTGPEGMGPGVIGDPMLGIEGLWVTSGGRPVVAYEGPLSPMEEGDGERRLVLQFVDRAPDSGPFLEIRNRQMLTLQGQGGAMSTFMPFGGRPVIEAGPGEHVYFGYSPDLVIRRKINGGATQPVVSREFPRVEVDEDLLQSELKEMGRYGDVSALQERVPTVLEKAPSRVPAFEDFAVDRRGRVWVAVNTRRALDGRHTEYWIFRSDGELLRKISFERRVILKAFSEQGAYGLANKPSGAQQIVRVSLDSVFQ